MSRMASIDFSRGRFRKSTVTCPVMSGSGTMFRSLLRAKSARASLTSRSLAEKEYIFWFGGTGVPLSVATPVERDLSCEADCARTRSRSGSGAGASGLVRREGALVADGPWVGTFHLSWADFVDLVDWQPPSRRAAASANPQALIGSRVLVGVSGGFMQINGWQSRAFARRVPEIDRRRARLL